MNNEQWGAHRHHYGWIIFAVAFGLIALIALSTFLFWQPVGFGYYPWYRGFFPFGWFFGLFWIFIIFFAIRWVFWRPWSGGWGYGRRYWGYRDDAYYVLRQRYAKGEITKEQYDQMMRDLDQHA